MILASGCSHAIDLSICVLAEHGQNILIPRPGFPLYKTLTSVYGVEYKQYNLVAEQDWAIDLEHLESLIDERTAAIVINNPSNPCGSVFSREHLLQILEIAERHRLPIIADEIYEKFVFAPEHYEGNASRTSQSIKSNPSFKTLHTKHHIESEDSTRSDLENKNPNMESINRSNNQSFNKSTTYRALLDESNVSQRQIQTTINTKQQIDFNIRIKDNNHFTRLNEPADSGIDLDDNETSMSDISFNTNGMSSSASSSTTTLHHVPFIAISALSERVPILTCGGISKTCLIPGLRLGWIIISDKQNNFDPSIRSGLSRLTQRLMGPNSLVQGALHDILMNVPETFYKQTMDFIFTNAKLCYDRLELVDGLQPFMPQGSMYLMVRFDAKSYPSIDGDLDFTSKLMNEESVLVLPGKCFDFSNYFRICLTVPTNVMEEAMNRIEEFCSRHRVRDTGATTQTTESKLEPCSLYNDYLNTKSRSQYPSFSPTNKYIVNKSPDRIHVGSIGMSDGSSSNNSCASNKYNCRNS